MARKPQRVGMLSDEVQIEDVEVEPQTHELELNTEIPTPTPSEARQDLPISTIKVNHPSLRRRNAPSMDAEVIDVIDDEGIYDIYAKQDGWGQLKDKSWVMLNFCSEIKK